MHFNFCSSAYVLMNCVKSLLWSQFRCPVYFLKQSVFRNKENNVDIFKISKIVRYLLKNCEEKKCFFENCEDRLRLNTSVNVMQIRLQLLIFFFDKILYTLLFFYIKIN